MLQQPGVEVPVPSLPRYLGEECTRYFWLLRRNAHAEGIRVPCTFHHSPRSLAYVRISRSGPLNAKKRWAMGWLVRPPAQAWPTPASFGDDPAVPSNLEPSKFATCPGWAAVPKWKWNFQVPGELIAPPAPAPAPALALDLPEHGRRLPACFLFRLLNSIITSPKPTSHPSNQAFARLIHPPIHPIPFFPPPIAPPSAASYCIAPRFVAGCCVASCCTASTPRRAHAPQRRRTVARISRAAWPCSASKLS